MYLSYGMSWYYVWCCVWCIRSCTQHCPLSPLLFIIMSHIFAAALLWPLYYLLNCHPLPTKSYTCCPHHRPSLLCPLLLSLISHMIPLFAFIMPIIHLTRRFSFGLNLSLLFIVQCIIVTPFDIIISIFVDHITSLCYYHLPFIISAILLIWCMYVWCMYYV